MPGFTIGLLGGSRGLGKFGGWDLRLSVFRKNTHKL